MLYDLRYRIVRFMFDTFIPSLRGVSGISNLIKAIAGAMQISERPVAFETNKNEQRGLSSQPSMSSGATMPGKAP